MKMLLNATDEQLPCELLPDDSYDDDPLQQDSNPTLSDSSDLCFGCVFCRTKCEKFVAHTLEEQYPDLKATPLCRVTHRSERGRKYTEEQIILPGYVFFNCDNGVTPDVFRIQYVLKLLKSHDGEWRLRGNDESFAQLVFQNNGTLGLSKVRRAGDRVRIHSGPLKDLEGQIVRVDKHSRNGQVALNFNNQMWKVWLAFEYME
jgi:transcription antitermination factor NusG